jgi:hypothetical protein
LPQHVSDKESGTSLSPSAATTLARAVGWSSRPRTRTTAGDSSVRTAVR